MIHDRKIIISVGNNRRSVNWLPQTLSLSELYEKLRVPARSTETMPQYLALKKAEQDDLKDVGGYVAGSLSGTRRKAGAVAGRDVITLDLDSIPPGGADDVLRRVEGLGCGYCVYSTRKHSAAAPRLRVLLPLDRTAAADEYEPAARKMAELIGFELADPTTFEAARLMYWPSCCADGEYIYTYQDKPMLSADGLLALFTDWRDISAWPRSANETTHTKLAARQGDPRAKGGVVGAFCRSYDIPGVMEAFLPGVYEPADGMPGRYTYSGGSTTGGAVIYDEARFLYSHHATDPCSGRLVNAFDLVRLHKFEGLDDAAAANTPNNRLPSYLAMCELAAADDAVAALMAKEKLGAALSDFEEIDVDWLRRLTKNAQTGQIKATIDNVWLILENDPNLKGKFALNEFAGRGEVLGALPWEKTGERRLWDDNDNQGLYWYLEKYYQLVGNGKIDGALSLHSVGHRFNEVRDYLNGLTWDGTPRLDSLLVDYLGASDDAYVRTVTRKAFTAAVARAMSPGCKYDAMLILSGAQGVGKSTLLDKMSRGWFNDNIRTFEGKEASELLQGVWLVEISELDAFKRTDTSRIKQFLSLRADRFRAAYGKHVKELPRRCVFFGTTNNTDFLQDDTGNRRFWPVDVTEGRKKVWTELDGEVDQIWAEAVIRWKTGETLYLSGEVERTAKEQQEAHREAEAKAGVVLDFLEREVPEDWQSWPLDKRRIFWGGGVTGELKLMPRDRVCALEIWCEAFNGLQKDIRKSDTRLINSIIAHAEGWARQDTTVRYGYCGTQRGYFRPQHSPQHSAQH
ncbi:MAG: virulence-associated E family protein [Oscillospiraceae bacterium]|nr:virulence-associated E family protein [Oscillospiraceae bacterium]